MTFFIFFLFACCSFLFLEYVLLHVLFNLFVSEICWFLVFCAVLQLCYNQFSGSIPTQLGSMKKLSVLSLQSNHLSGALPASLGDLGMLKRLDLSFNNLFGSIPTRLADAPMLRVLDVRNNTLSGNVPLGIVVIHGYLFPHCFLSCIFFLPNIKIKSLMSNTILFCINSRYSVILRSIY